MPRVIPSALPRVTDLIGSVKLPPLDRIVRRPEITYFAYSVVGADGETTSQEDIFAVSPVTGDIRRITDDRDGPYISDRDPAWAPDRSSIALHRSDGGPSRLYVIASGTGVTTAAHSEGFSPVWARPDWLLYRSQIDPATGAAFDPWRIEVWALNLVNGGICRITDVGPERQIDEMSWHPAAGLVLGMSEAGGSSRLYVIPAAAVHAARLGGLPVASAGLTPLTAIAGEAGAPSWSPTADRVAYSTWTPGSPSRVGFIDLETGKVTLVPGPVAASPVLADYGPVFSPDGKQLAFCRGHEDEYSEICLYNVNSRKVRQLTDENRTRFKGSLDW